MAKKGGNPKNLKPFPPGVSGNPGGKIKLPEEVRKLAVENRRDFSLFVNRYLGMDHDEIKNALKNPKASMLELMVGGIIEEAAKRKDVTKANWITEQVFGKLKDQIEVTHNYQMLSDEELVVIARQAILALTGGQG